MAVSPWLATLAPVQAAPIAVTDRAAFDATVAGLAVSTLDFERVAGGTLIADCDTLGGITFSYPTRDILSLGLGLAGLAGGRFARRLKPCRSSDSGRRPAAFRGPVVWD